jgi:hypothetical protein
MAASALASHRGTANSPLVNRKIAGKQSWHWEAQKEGTELMEMHKVIEGTEKEELIRDRKRADGIGVGDADLRSPASN